VAVIPPDIVDRLRRLEEDVRELRGRLPAPPADEPAQRDADSDEAR
jgi:hypothetical protein